MARPIVLVAGRDPRGELSGGHSAYVRSHALALKAAGFEPHIFCAGRRSIVGNAAYGSVHRVASPVPSIRQLLAPWHAPFLSRAIERFGAACPQPVAVHSFGVWGYPGSRAVRRLRARGIPTVHVLSSYTTYEDEHRSKVDGLNPASGMIRGIMTRAAHLWVRLAVERYEREAYQAADAVLYNYESVRRLIEHHLTRSARLVRAPYTAETAFDDPAHQPRGAAIVPRGIARLRPERAPLILCISRHDPRKGTDTLLEALARLRSRGIPFRAMLVGGGELLHVDRRTAAKLGLGVSCSIPGVVSDIRPYLALADVYVLPSRREQSGSLALIEAMGAGRAIVASSCDGIPEDVTDGVDAILTPPGDVVALAAALERCLLDPSLRERLGAQAKATFATRFSAALVAGGLRDIYASLGVTP